MSQRATGTTHLLHRFDLHWAPLSVHPHMLRHSAGYVLVNKGFNLRVIQTHLGHSLLENTARYTALDHSRLKNLF
jgi:site-specific recombinase XerD